MCRALLGLRGRFPHCGFLWPGLDGKLVRGYALTELSIEDIGPAQQKREGQNKQKQRPILFHAASLTQQPDQPLQQPGGHQDADDDEEAAADTVDDLIVAFDPIKGRFELVDEHRTE